LNSRQGEAPSARLIGRQKERDERNMIDSRNYTKEYTKDFVSYWDDLIGWEGREKGESGFFQRMLTVHDARTVLDCACGTGFHSVTLARDGFEVTASDGSANMLAQTVENAEDYGVKLADAEVADWLHLHEKFGPAKFDALVCLGNAFTHLFDHELRREALRSMYSVVKPGGLVMIDHRNYDRMLDDGFSSKHMYYYTGKGVDARPVELHRTLAHFEYTFPDGEQFHLKLYPLKQDYMRHLMEEAGFQDVLTYGDFERPFDSNDVDFIQQVAVRPMSDDDTLHPEKMPEQGNGSGNGAAHNG
jgi:glycine/sarcosine N-methyltransferase